MACEIPMKAHAHRADDIFTAIRIAKEFDLKLTLDHCTESALIADELVKEGYPAFVGPTMSNISKYELLSKSFNTPAILNSAGVDIAIITDAGVYRYSIFLSLQVWQLNPDSLMKKHGKPSRSTRQLSPE